MDLRAGSRLIYSGGALYGVERFWIYPFWNRDIIDYDYGILKVGLKFSFFNAIPKQNDIRNAFQVNSPFAIGYLGITSLALSNVRPPVLTKAIVAGWGYLMVRIKISYCPTVPNNQLQSNFYQSSPAKSQLSPGM